MNPRFARLLSAGLVVLLPAEDRSIYQVGNYFNKRQGTLFYEPDLSRQGFNRDFSRDVGARFTWQAAAKHKVVLSYTQHPACQCMFAILEQVSPVRAPEAVAEHHYNPQNLSVANYTYPVTSRLLIEADASRSQYWRNQKRIPGTTSDVISVTDPSQLDLRRSDPAAGSSVQPNLPDG